MCLGLSHCDGPFFVCRRWAVLQSCPVPCLRGWLIHGRFICVASQSTRNQPHSRYSVLSRATQLARLFAHLLERHRSNLCRDVEDSHRNNLCSTVPLLETTIRRAVAMRQWRNATRGEGNYSIFRIGYWGIWFLKRVCIPGVLGLFYIRGILGFLFVQGFLR